MYNIISTMLTVKQKFKKAGIDYKRLGKTSIEIQANSFRVDYNLYNGHWYIIENIKIKNQGVATLIKYFRKNNEVTLNELPRW